MKKENKCIKKKTTSLERDSREKALKSGTENYKTRSVLQ